MSGTWGACSTSGLSLQTSIHHSLVAFENVGNFQMHTFGYTGSNYVRGFAVDGNATFGAVTLSECCSELTGSRIKFLQNYNCNCASSCGTYPCGSASCTYGTGQNVQQCNQQAYCKCVKDTFSYIKQDWIDFAEQLCPADDLTHNYANKIKCYQNSGDVNNPVQIFPQGSSESPTPENQWTYVVTGFGKVTIPSNVKIDGSIIAPESNVDVSNCHFVHGYIVARKAKTTHSGDQLHGQIPTTIPECYTPSPTEAPVSENNGVISDPWAYSASGKSIKFTLGKDHLMQQLLDWGNNTLSLSTFTSKDGFSWVEKIDISIDGQHVLIEINPFILNDSNVTDCDSLSVIVDGKLQTIGNISPEEAGKNKRIILSGGSVLLWRYEITDEARFVGSCPRQVAMIETPQIDIKILSTEGVSSGHSDKEWSRQQKMRNSHLDFNAHVVKDSSKLNGPLAELWGYKTMTEAVKSMVVEEVDNGKNPV